MTAESKIENAVWLIFAALFWDSLDGNIARALKNPTAFGRELDSLADQVSFVIAPTFLVLQNWAYALTPWTLAAILGFLAAGTYRLARFNIHHVHKNYFEGLPTPAAACVLAMMVLAHLKNTWIDPSLFASFLFILVLLLSFLMASRVPYPKLSAVPFRQWRFLFYLELILFPVVLFTTNLEAAIASIFLIFLLLGPTCCPFPRQIPIEIRPLRPGKGKL